MNLRNLFLVTLTSLSLSLFANETQNTQEPEKPKALSYQEQRENVIEVLKSIINTFNVFTEGVESIKTRRLSTEELELRIILYLNYTLLVRAYLYSVPEIADAVGHELFHATNHISTASELYDQIEKGDISKRRGLVKLYRYNTPIMFKVINDVVIKALKVMLEDKDKIVEEKPTTKKKAGKKQTQDEESLAAAAA